MRDVRIGKTDDLDVTCVIYYLSDTKDIFRVINEIAKAIGGCDRIGELPYVFRYTKGNKDTGELMVGVSTSDKNKYSRKPKKEDIIEAEDLENYVKILLKDLDFFEMENGLYAVKVPMDDMDRMSEICNKLLCVNSDLWLSMGNQPQRVAFKPDYIKDSYVLAQYVIPCFGDSDKVKTIKDLSIALC